MLILIQVFVFSAIVWTLSPTVSAAQSDANTKTSQSDFPGLPVGEDVGLDWFDSANNFKPEFVPGEVLVNFTESISVRLEDGKWTTGIGLIDKLLERFKVTWITRIFSNVYKLTLPKDADVLYVAREYGVDPYVEYAEPNGIYRTFLVPNDANYTQQWAHQVIRSEYAWNVTTGDPSVVIAIVDSGVDYNHPDLAANLWINTDEIPNNGIDDDQNGFVDDVRGWDFVEAPDEVYPGEDGTQPDNDPMDFLGHGTHVAGIAAAVTNNAIGIAGVSWKSKIMAVRSAYAVYGGGALTYDQAAVGIRYAADNGADIINLSFGGTYRSKVVYDAVKYAYDKGVLLVAAAGNSYWRIKTYPAAYEEVVAVTATDQNDNSASFTNFGNWVEVAAPGVNILSTVSPNASNGPYRLKYPYDYASGTSMAAPHVAGVAALILSQFPYMTRDQVRVQLRRTADDHPPFGFDIYYGYGRINAVGAVKQVPAAHDLLVLSWKLPFVSEPSDIVTVNTTVLNFGTSTENNLIVKLLVNGTQVDSKQITSLSVGQSAKVNCSWTPVSEGIYNVTTYVVPARRERSDVTENNVQSAYSWVRYGKAVKVPNDFPTILEAIDTTNLGIYGGDATIRISKGTYNEYDLLIQNMLKSLTLAGENSYTTVLSGNPYLDGLLVNADNVTIKGLTIRNSSVGIQLWGGNGIVSSNNLTNNRYGIFASGYYNNTVRDNIVSKNSELGISLVWSSGNTVINNTASSNEYGLYLGAANKTMISGNTITNNYYGISLMSSSDDVLTNNALTGNTYGFGVLGDTLSQFIHHIDTTNTVDGKPIYYLINQSNLVIEPSSFPNVGYLGLVNSTGVTVRDLTISKSIQGVMFAYTKDSKIQNVNSSNNTYGIYLSNSNKTSVSGNTLLKNGYGIRMRDSHQNTLDGNVITEIDKEGIYLESSSGNIISGNTVSNCSRTGYYNGIYLSDSANNFIISGNTISYNRWYGIRTFASSNNVIYHNNFINNTRQVYSSKSYNSWDNGAAGNYWSDYNGQDLNGDGIGDTPYVIDADNRDRYPLMNPWVKPIPGAYALNLRVMDWDLTDSIQGAYVYVDLNLKISDASGWANWTGISGIVYVKVKWHSVWVNGTFLVVVDSNKTINIKSNVFDITVTTIEGGQGAVLQYVNVTVYDATGNIIRTGITDSEGKVYLNNVPNSTLTLTAYDGFSSQVIANVSRTITTENQAETIICDQNYVSTVHEWSIIADYNTFYLSLIPFSPSLVLLLASHAEKSFSLLKCLKINVRGLKERVKTIRSKQNKRRDKEKGGEKR